MWVQWDELSLEHQSLNSETTEDNSYGGVIVPPSTSKKTTESNVYSEAF